MKRKHNLFKWGMGVNDKKNVEQIRMGGDIRDVESRLYMSQE